VHRRPALHGTFKLPLYAPGHGREAPREGVDGVTIDIDPVLLRVGGFALRWYGLAFAGGIGLGIWIAMRQGRRLGLDPDSVAGVAFWAVVGGIAGARIVHVVDRLDYYLAHPAQVLLLHEGGLAVWGGVLGGVLAGFIAARRARLPIGRGADAAALALPAGLILGRAGCVVNGDAYGAVTTLPWGFAYVNPGAMVPAGLVGVSTHPYPVYEMLWLLGVAGLLLVLRGRSLPPGMLFLVFAGAYATGRIVLGFLRQESVVVAGLQQAQVIALVVLIVAAAGILWMSRPASRRGRVPELDGVRAAGGNG
jgi:phosphatidylglycerol---prolipoprotein diacylglyceryl transferase